MMRSLVLGPGRRQLVIPRFSFMDYIASYTPANMLAFSFWL